MKSRVIDLRTTEVSADFSKRNTSRFFGYTLAVLLVVSGAAYTLWLDAGCVLQGAMTWHGKVCLE